MNIIEQFEKDQMTSLIQDKVVDAFNIGDTVKVNVKVKEGATERLQSYEGVVIAKRNKRLTTSFIVRKISHGESVERRFMLYSPIVESVKVVKRGVVRRAKLYYLRNRRGKAARIKSLIR